MKKIKEKNSQRNIYKDRENEIPSFFFYLLFLIQTIMFIFLFDSNGAIGLTLIASIFIIIILSSVRIMNRSLRKYLLEIPVDKSLVSFLGPFIIYHCHHNKKLIEKGKEFRIKNKYFCTGCYGVLFGIIIGDTIAFLYLAYSLSFYLKIYLSLSIPIWFIPIILRYTLFTRMRSSFRFISNLLFPIGCWILLIVGDSIFNNWIINGFIMVFFGITIKLRVSASARENKQD